MLKSLVAVTLMVAAFPVLAEVEIVDSKPFGQQQPSVTSPVSPGPNSTVQIDNNLQNELYFQLQTLQQEVQELRGMLEEQSFELKRLKQQRLDDYLDLDRRLSQLGKAGGGVPSTATAVNGTTSNPIATPVKQVASPSEELADYRAAMDLILKKRDFDGGAAALHRFLDKFPSGNYTANAQYWLGQIYFQKEDLQQSQKWFTQMIQQYPQHQKIGEAKYKLARVLQKMGDVTKAKVLLQEVAKSDSSAANLAADYLKTLTP